MLATRSSVEVCITFFVAFHVLCTIDNIYAEGVCDYALMEALHEPLVFTKKPHNMPFKERDTNQKMLRLVLKGVRFMYNTVYYYYMPYVVNFVPYFFVGDPDHMPTGGGH